MRPKLEAQEDYQRMRGYYDMFLLVASIKGINFRFNGNKHPSTPLHDAKRYFYRYYQTEQTKIRSTYKLSRIRSQS